VWNTPPRRKPQTCRKSQTLSHNVVSSTPRHERNSTQVGDESIFKVENIIFLSIFVSYGSEVSEKIELYFYHNLQE
jgi:hypothetical protein